MTANSRGQKISNFEELLVFNQFGTEEQRLHMQDLDSIIVVGS